MCAWIFCFTFFSLSVVLSSEEEEEEEEKENGTSHVQALEGAKDPHKQHKHVQAMERKKIPDTLIHPSDLTSQVGIMVISYMTGRITYSCLSWIC